MRAGEVLKIRPIDVKDNKITLSDPKSGRESEIVFIPPKIADRLRGYIQDKGFEPDQRIFPITYNAARVMVKKAVKIVGVSLREISLAAYTFSYNGIILSGILR
jgi:integrase